MDPGGPFLTYGCHTKFETPPTRRLLFDCFRDATWHLDELMSQLPSLEAVQKWADLPRESTLTAPTVGTWMPPSFLNSQQLIRSTSAWCFQPTSEQYESEGPIIHPQVRVEHQNIRFPSPIDMLDIRGPDPLETPRWLTRMPGKSRFLPNCSTCSCLGGCPEYPQRKVKGYALFRGRGRPNISPALDPSWFEEDGTSKHIQEKMHQTRSSWSLSVGNTY